MNLTKHLPLVNLKLHHQEAKLSSGVVFCLVICNHTLLQTNSVGQQILHIPKDFKVVIALTEKALGAPPRTTTSYVGRGYLGSTYIVNYT
jgi:hypothetical protein